MRFDPSESSPSFWIVSILEELEKQLAALCAFYFNWGEGIWDLRLKKRSGLTVMR